ncbi:MAG: SWIM zinc finger family protein, partial [Saccharofermentanales bacterium]
MTKIADAAELFKSHIYERGEAISFSDSINITHKSADLITAIVEGTEYYDVRIMMENGYITDMSCTCPYADTGENCKHMAAVLIHCFEDIRDADVKDPSERISVKSMISDFESICQFYMERERFISYSRASRFFIELDGFLDRIKSLIDNGSLIQAAQVIAGITQGFDDLPMDDSDGGTTDFYMRIVELLNTILSRKNEEANDFVFHWISQAIADERNWYLSEMLQPVWESQFNESELIDKKIKQMTDRLKLPVSSPEEKAEDHSFISNLMVLAELMLERGDDAETVESVLAPFMCSYRVLAWLAELARSNGHQEKEFELIKKGYELAHEKNYSGIINQFGLKLCRYYQRTGQTEEYSTALRELVMSNPHHLEYYHEYKALFSQDEWDTERDVIIEKFEMEIYRSKSLLEI